MYPPWHLQIAYLDTAFTKKEGNDFCALVRLGVFANPSGTPCAMLCGAWQERHNFGELIEHVKASCRQWKTDILVIENKAGGVWVRDELIREMNAGEVQIELDTPVVDKVSRAHAVVPLFVGKLVYAPFMHDQGVWRSWAEMVISTTEKFPTGRFDDVVDGLTGGLGYLRRNNLIKLSEEHIEDELESKRFEGGSGTTLADDYGVT
jgi:predicted phage terminase large subunit-like protein